jgi:hypothetical protein
LDPSALPQLRHGLGHLQRKQSARMLLVSRTSMPE